jgi:hypothetical protein
VRDGRKCGLNVQLINNPLLGVFHNIGLAGGYFGHKIPQKVSSVLASAHFFSPALSNGVLIHG